MYIYMQICIDIYMHTYVCVCIHIKISRYVGSGLTKSKELFLFWNRKLYTYIYTSLLQFSLPLPFYQHNTQKIYGNGS